MESNAQTNRQNVRIDRHKTEKCTHLREELDHLATNGIKKAKECIDFLKFSEGLVRRDIDLIRMQLEIKLKKLESRLQAELRNIVERETSRLEKFIADVESVKDTNLDSTPMEKLSEMKDIVATMVRQRLKFEANKSLEKSLDEITSFGTIVIDKVDQGSNNIKNKTANKGTVNRPNGFSNMLSDTGSNRHGRHISSGNETDIGSLGGQSNIENKTQKDSIKTNKMNGDIKHKVDAPSLANEIDKLDSKERTNIIEAESSKVKSAERSEGKSTMGNNVSDWRSADPLSVLRALKRQTSRTEENLRALKDFNDDNGDDGIVKTNRSVKENENNDIENKSAPSSDERKSRDWFSSKAKQTSQNENSQCDNLHQTNGIIADDDDYLYMDRVTRANEIWFGRDRTKRREDFKFRRTRSLSPKSVRFRLEYSPERLQDQADDLDVCGIKELTNIPIRNGFKHEQMTHTEHGYSEIRGFEKQNINKRGGESVAAEQNCVERQDVRKQSQKTADKQTDEQRRGSRRNDQDNKISGKSTNSKSKFATRSKNNMNPGEPLHLSMETNSLYDRRRNVPKAASNDNLDDTNNISNEMMATPRTLSENSRVESIPNDKGTCNTQSQNINNINSERKTIDDANEDRRQRLRNKRRRNNTISVITPADFVEISNAKSLGSGQTDQVDTFHTPKTDGSTCSDYVLTDKSRFGISDAPLINSSSDHIEIQKAMNGNGKDSHSYRTSIGANSTAPRPRPYLDEIQNRRTTRIDLQNQRVSHSYPNSTTVKSNNGRQKLPSFREMLFSE